MSILISLIREADNFISLKPASLSQISEAESRLKLSFSEDYTEYLVEFGAASFAGKELTGICESERLSVVSTTEKARIRFPRFPSNAYVIEDLYVDHMLIVQDCSGKVYLYGSEDCGREIAGSLKDYLFPSDQ